jgi:signal transduction histidine kinase
MRKSKLIWHLYPAFSLIVIASLFMITFLTARFFRAFYFNQLQENLKIRAQFFEKQLGSVNSENFDRIDNLCKELFQLNGTRITIILPQGRVIGDSEKDPFLMEDHSDRPEFKAAFQNGLGRSVRFSNTLGINMMYVAIPSKEDNKIIAVVRTSLPVEIINNTLGRLYKRIIITGIIVAVFVIGLSWHIARNISTPIERMKEAAQHFALGDFERRVERSNIRELDELAKSLNQMSEKMNGKIESITKDKNEAQEVLKKMSHIEKVRSDFVANVSHELRTPITSIKGFVETLLEGAVKDPEQVKRFLQIISRHSDRLDAIINDLLALSRLEEEGGKRKLFFHEQYIKPVLLTAIEFAKIKAESKKITLEIECDIKLKAKINAPLIEQAVLNLVYNAIKYSPENSNIKVKAVAKEEAVVIEVTDNGCGIEEKHLSRIFERFYVVDKARSRKLGGTGLGLSIVKHICQVHGGSVSVESVLEKGTTFTIHLPSM